MARYFQHQADVSDACGIYQENYFDAVLCDPPYGINFMGKKWDYQVPTKEQWQEVFYISKPGAHLISFGGTKTYHRVVCNIEDAGFQPRDQLQWLYAKGMPKNHNISKSIDKKLGVSRPIIGTQVLTGNAAVSLKDKGGTYGVQVGVVPPKTVDVTGAGSDEAKLWEGHGTALKPCWEPALLAMKPIEGTYVENALKWGTGGIAIDANRIGVAQYTQEQWSQKSSTRTNPNTYGEPTSSNTKAPEGRWPSNLLLDIEAGEMLDNEVGPRKRGKSITRNGGGGKIFNGSGSYKEGSRDGGYTDSGGPSRFFYSTKVNTNEREAGCEHLTLQSSSEITDREEGSVGLEDGRAGAGRTTGARNNHPTLKPISLCTRFASLILPPPHTDGTPRRIFIPFSGAGSEVIGALLAGWDEVYAVELDPHYVEIAEARVKHWCKEVL